MSGQRILVIGGNAAGMTAASRAKRLDPSLDVTVLEASARIAYSICGLPYFVAGLVPDIAELELFTPASLENERGIDARVNCRAVELLPSQRRITVEDAGSGESETLGYDKLLVATGYRPLTPDIEGVELDGVFTASRLGDGESIDSWISKRQARRGRPRGRRLCRSRNRGSADEAWNRGHAAGIGGLRCSPLSMPTWRSSSNTSSSDAVYAS